MGSLILKRSILLAGHKTSVSLEDEFWTSLREIAGEQRETVSRLVAKIDETRKASNLSSAIRLFVLRHYRGRKVEIASPELNAPNAIEDRAH